MTEPTVEVTVEILPREQKLRTTIRAYQGPKMVAESDTIEGAMEQVLAALVAGVREWQMILSHSRMEHMGQAAEIEARLAWFDALANPSKED